jgi:CheY-like chemotaxis protein
MIPTGRDDAGRSPMNSQSFRRRIWVDVRVVMIASTGEEAIGIAGLETTRQLKERQPWLRITVVSGYASESDQQRAVQAGADGYIAKPYNAPALLAKVASLLG